MTMIPRLRHYILLTLSLAVSLAAYDVTSETLTQTVRFSTTEIDLSDPAARLTPSNITTALSTFNGKTYLVWVDDQRIAKITQITGEISKTVELDPDPDYRVQPDCHHHFSLGIDKNGYIHVVGDMHDFKGGEKYLPRFRKANAMYWVSDKPEDISSFTFVGDHPARGLPLGRYTYTQFYNDQDMELYLVCRISITPSGFYPGVRGLGLAYYDASKQQWSARGNKPAPENAVYPCILWEDNGWFSKEFPTPAYQGYQVSLLFDSNNRMHLASTIGNDNRYQGATHVVYACSDDGGQTFHRADGTRIGELPMRVEDLKDSEGRSRQVDIVRASTELGDHYWAFAGVYLQADHQPAVAYWPNGKYPKGGNSWNHLWDVENQRWSEHFEQPTAGSARPINICDKHGVLTYFSTSRFGEIVRTMHPEDKAMKRSWLHHSLVSYDRLALRNEGIIRIVGIHEGNEEKVPSLSVLDLDFHQ